MLYVIILVSIVAIFLFARFHAYKKELTNIRKQLQNYNSQRTNKKIDIALIERNMEDVAAEINQLIDLHINEKKERIRFETKLKQLVANMSHDLRTPLTSIIGYIQMAESEKTTIHEQKQYITIAKERAHRLETLLSDFFELSIIETDDYHLKTNKINVKNITSEVLMSFYDRFNEKNWEPTILFPEDDIYIIADESAVKRVIENLISNALTHSTGNIIVTLEDNDSTVRLVIANDTDDLTASDIERFFDRFYKVDPSRSSKSTGLGLSIVKGFMLKMNGNIKANLIDGQLSIICEWKSFDHKFELK